MGRRVVLGLLGLGALGIAAGAGITNAMSKVTAKDPTGLTNLIPGSGGFRYYSVAGPVAEIPTSTFALTIDGLVDRPGSLTFADLAALPQTTLHHDVQCVTGWRVPDVTWGGVLLRDVLSHVGAQTTGQAVLFGSADGEYTESLTREQAERADVLIATSLSGAPVSNAHGGPVRLYVAPMYFYKSLKWLNRITVSDRVVPGYWEELGYDVDAWVGQSNGRDDAPTV